MAAKWIEAKLMMAHNSRLMKYTTKKKKIRTLKISKMENLHYLNTCRRQITASMSS